MSTSLKFENPPMLTWQSLGIEFIMNRKTRSEVKNNKITYDSKKVKAPPVSDDTKILFLLIVHK